MLEYETANPNQDASKPEGDHFNPYDNTTSNPRVSFAPEDYADPTLDEESMHVMARESGARRRPYSESPAPPHANDQFTGPVVGGMHGEEIAKPTHSVGGDSDRTLPVGNPNPQAAAVNTSAIKPGSRGSNANRNWNGDVEERSVRSNTYANRNMTCGMVYDEELSGDKQGG